MWKQIVAGIYFFLIQQMAVAQVKLPIVDGSLFSKYYHQRVSYFRHMPETQHDVIFLGNSITDGSEWNELFGDKKIKNRGISADITPGLFFRLDEVVGRKPDKIFLLIGTNDLARGIPADTMLKNIFLINRFIKQESPTTRLYVQSILPVNDVFGLFTGHTGNTLAILRANEILRNAANTEGYTFIDLYPHFINAEGMLDTMYSNDGLHLMGGGYLLWKHLIYPKVYDLQEKPSLIPLPAHVEWKRGFFPLFECSSIVINDNKIISEADYLQRLLKEKGWDIPVTKKVNPSAKNIILSLTSDDKKQLPAGSYSVDITNTEIVVKATTPQGIYYGIQTLRQLMRDGAIVDACAIQDQPAFPWRGFMVDVGRNYMSMPLLKQMIDVMAQYKLNIFHFHGTEDIAWRFASAQYPQLTAPENMLRNKGMYYTKEEIRELTDYCRDRHITFVPEIDMPGHSAAFSRAMKVDMQSDSGMTILKNILDEFCESYDVPYFHIGADEVRITNKDFVPEMTDFLEQRGKQVIGWQPGGNFTKSTIRQLWMDDNAHHSSGDKVRYIDSRHLYLNHMDPMEAVTTIYNRKIGDKERGDNNIMGGTICLWPDRAVAKEEDVLRMNPVYPGMLAFAERSWCGGGQSGWVANIDDGDKAGFIEFEQRLLDNKKTFFEDKIFNFVKQSDIVWQLYGPFPNGGDVEKAFPPEKKAQSLTQEKAYKEVTGGTVVLRHWWAPLIKGGIAAPEDSTTWYATTRIWSDEAGVKSFWIGFNNVSRSPATDSPLAGMWNNSGNAVWVNGLLVPPPHWIRAGQKGNSEIPLIDEGYEYRTPTDIYLKKGWNQILVKAPIGSFRGKDWQNPVKWMFTFVEVK